MKIEFNARGVTQIMARNGRIAATGKVNRISKEVVRDSVLYAKRIAPEKYGYLKAGISGVYGWKNMGVKSITPKTKDGRKRPYHLWMNGVGVYNTSAQIKTGEPNYMELTAKYMKRLARQEFRKHIRDTLKNGRTNNSR